MTFSYLPFLFVFQFATAKKGYHKFTYIFIIHDLSKKCNSIYNKSYSVKMRHFSFLSLLYGKLVQRKIRHFAYLAPKNLALREAWCLFAQNTDHYMKVFGQLNKNQRILKMGCFLRKMWYNSHEVHNDCHPSHPRDGCDREYSTAVIRGSTATASAPGAERM